MKEAIEKLHFDPKWFEYDFLDDQFFVRQIALFDKAQHGIEDEDEDGVWLDSEHHRYCAFRTILSSAETLNDEQLEHYIELCHLDEDQAMAYAALGQLFEWPGLNSDQRQILEDHPVFKDSGHLKRIQYRRMLDELFSRPCPEELFEEIIASADTARQLTLVQSPHTSRPQLERLLAEGSTRKTRNMARNRLRSRRPWRVVKNPRRKRRGINDNGQADKSASSRLISPRLKPVEQASSLLKGRLIHPRRKQRGILSHSRKLSSYRK